MAAEARKTPDDAIALKPLGGAGPPLLLLHGFGADRLSFLANLSALEPVASLFALDLPGHGESGADVGDGSVATLAARVARALDAAGLTRLDLVAHSLGGAVGLRLAETQPERVRSLALIAPAGLGVGLDAGFLHAFPKLATPEAALALLQRLVSRPRLIGKPLAARLLDQLARPRVREALARIGERLIQDAPALAETAATVAARDPPRLTIWGELDAINPLAPEKLAAFGGEWLILPDAAHLPQVESFGAVNARLVAFLGGLGAA